VGGGIARNVGEEGDWVIARNNGEEGDLAVTRTVGKKGDRVVARIVGKPPTLTKIKSRVSNRPSLLNELSHRPEFIIRRLE
jgi:hypothetical protein